MTTIDMSKPTMHTCPCCGQTMYGEFEQPMPKRILILAHCMNKACKNYGSSLCIGQRPIVPANELKGA